MRGSTSSASSTALNWVPNMKVAMDAVVETGAICEAAICYTGDILNPKRTKYDLKYYVDLAKELEKMGAHILAIKDMAGLCKPAAARKLVKALKQEIGIPIHFHTHDTAGIQAASILKAAEVGLDIADAAMAPMSGGTSQPNLNTLVEVLRFTDRDTALDSDRLDAIAEYWRAVREFYTPFESVSLAGDGRSVSARNAGRAVHESVRAGPSPGPGRSLAGSLPDLRRSESAVRRHRQGDADSKSVGDMALFMVANNLTCEDVLNPDRDLAFPGSVIDLISGGMGQPPGGFPEAVQEAHSAGKEAVRRSSRAKLCRPPTSTRQRRKSRTCWNANRPAADVISWLLYERVYEEFAMHQHAVFRRQHSADAGLLLRPGTRRRNCGRHRTGQDADHQVLSRSATPHADGTRTVFFELNGQPREMTVADQSLEADRRSQHQSRPGDRRTSRRHDARHGRDRRRQSRRPRQEGPEAADPGSHENGNHHLRRTRRQNPRRPRPAGPPSGNRRSAGGD